MTTTVDYRVIEHIHSGRNSRVFRAADDGGQTVVLKMPHSAYPSARDLDRLRHEYAMLCRFDSPYIIRAQALNRDIDGMALVLEDVAAISLGDTLAGHPISLERFFPIAIAAASAIQAVHAQRVIHRDVNPSNLVVNPQSGAVKLIDFGIAATLSREPQQPSALDAFEGTLAYISPEQTGRMNRAVDFRTDLYSLGATCYEMLVGHPPFESHDPLELVHCHIARTPASPRDLRADIPPALAAIVLKLLAKNAEDRYQTAAGLLADLQHCRDLWLSQGGDADFLIGQHDVSDRFRVPERLYGREQEIAALIDAFARASQGPAELLLLAGYSGVGKSRLVQEVQRPIVAHKGYFIAGKFDQLKRNIPFGSLFSAFRDLIQQILTESESRVATWRARLLDALGSVGQVMIDAIPELELLLGAQPAVAELPPDQARNRFGEVFRRFVQAFCRPEHPLCIFLDDLQWVDSATLQWLEQTLGAERAQYMLLIGAYRDNETSASHPLRMTLDRLQAQGTPAQTISLRPLDRRALGDLVADSLATSPARCADLADIVYAKTDGNPFFVSQCLLTLYEGDAISFDAAAQTWGYDIERARAARISDNVADLIAARISGLAPATQHVVKVAACVGNRFDLATLLVVLGQGRDAVREQLQIAVDGGLLVTLRSWAAVGQEQYGFLHDRVQQAALSLLAEGEITALRLQIGRLMLAASPDIAEDEQIFDIVDHLGAAVSLIREPAELARISAVCLIAGQRAKRATAYEIARDYSARALALHRAAGLPAAAALPILAECAECEHLCGDNRAAEALYDEALGLAGTPMDKLQVYERKVHFYTNQSRFADAYATGRAALQLFNTQLPASFTPPLFAADLVKVQYLMRGRKIASLVDLPQADDEQTRAVVRLMAAVAKAAYQIKPQLCIAVAAKIVALGLQRGNIGDSVIGYMALGAIFLGGILGNHRTGYEYGLASLALLDRYDHKKHRAEVHFVVGYFATSWLRPASEAEALWQIAYTAGLETGDLFHAACACCGTLQSHLMRGVHLEEIWQESEQFLDFLTRAGSAEGVGTATAVRQTIRNLRGQTSGTASFSEPGFDEGPYVAGLAGYGSRHFAHYYFINKMMTLYLWGHHDAGLAVSQRSAEFLADSTGMLHSVEHFFYRALLLCAAYTQARPRQRRAWMGELRGIQTKLQKWAGECPANYEHKARLIDAEIARVRGEPALAAEAYQTAIASAAAHGYVQVQAIANERAARFHDGLGRQRIAAFHFQEAAYFYARWGADAYADNLAERYPQYLGAEPEGQHRQAEEGTRYKKTTSTEASGGSLDLTTVLKASETISSEIELPALLHKLMTIIIENAGAQRGVLALRRGQQLLVQAEIGLDGERVLLVDAVPLSEYDGLPQSVLNYVARAREPVVLGDAAQEGAFTQDAYIVARQPRSVLCQPLINQGKLAGVLYLENNLAVGAFTPGRLRLLSLLSAQAAIAIENATLYTTLQTSEKKYRALFEESRDSIFVATLDDRILDMNPAGLGLFGYAPEAMRAAHVADLYASPADLARFRALLDGGGEVKDFETRLRAGDGRAFDSLLTASLRYAESGALVGYQGVIRDISAQKQAEQERLRLSAIERELSLAQELQRGLLPAGRPEWPEIDLRCYTMPAREVGGDFYSYHRLPDAPAGRRFALAVGDVTGKGVGAALLMATALSQFDASITLDLAPAARLAHLDRAILPYTRPRRQNCALCYVEITRADDATSQLQVINAGCIPPYIRRADGALEQLEIGGFALGQGLGDKLGYQALAVGGGAGDLIILTSDGVVEAMSPAGEMFGFERLGQAIAAGPVGDAAGMLDYLRATLDAFVGGVEPHDDMTIVIAQL